MPVTTPNPYLAYWAILPKVAAEALTPTDFRLLRSLIDQLHISPQQMREDLLWLKAERTREADGVDQGERREDD